MATYDTTRTRAVGLYHTAHGSYRKGNFIECSQCHKVYIEDLVCQDTKTRLDFCIRCYNRRDDAEKIETKREIIERVCKDFESSAERTP